MTLKSLILAGTLAATPLAASAHAPKIGHNGGPQTNAGSFHLEVVPQGATLAVDLRDYADKEMKTDGYKGAAIFMIDGKPERIDLAPAGENRLTGTASVPLPAEPKGAVQISTPTGSTVQGKFN
jgi:hypothetical protein